jgi:hypothetical protein
MDNDDILEAYRGAEHKRGEIVTPKWRVGRNVPLNVYAGDRPVCQCHNATDALLIVSAVNQFLEGKGGR